MGQRNYPITRTTPRLHSGYSAPRAPSDSCLAADGGQGGPLSLPFRPLAKKASHVQLRPGGELEVNDGTLQALVTELQGDHPFHVRWRGLQAGEDQGDGAVDHGLASLRGEVADHLLLQNKGKEGLRRTRKD